MESVMGSKTGHNAERSKGIITALLMQIYIRLSLSPMVTLELKHG